MPVSCQKWTFALSIDHLVGGPSKHVLSSPGVSGGSRQLNLRVTIRACLATQISLWFRVPFPKQVRPFSNIRRDPSRLVFIGNKPGASDVLTVGVP